LDQEFGGAKGAPKGPSIMLEEIKKPIACGSRSLKAVLQKYKVNCVAYLGPISWINVRMGSWELSIHDALDSGDFDFEESVGLIEC